MSCPGCYAYGSEHLGGVLLRKVSDYKGSELIERTVALVRQYRPLHVSIVGGEPLVRFWELNQILPLIAAQGIYWQVVTSAVRPIPAEWMAIDSLKVMVSIDGLQPEHDERRKPATYERILKHIADRRITAHGTVTRQQVRRAGYIEDFVKFWSGRPEVAQIWLSLYTPQTGEISAERLTPGDRTQVADDLLRLRTIYPKLPDCGSCGCFASAALATVGRHRLPTGLRVGTTFEASLKVGAAVRWSRKRPARATPVSVPVAAEAD